MAISNSYPSGIPIADEDLFVGTKAYNNRTVNYTAQGVADYLNINSKVAIGGQMSFQFTIVPNMPKTIAFEGGLGNNTAFSAITKLIVSAMDLSTANITIFLNYLNNSQVLLSEQNQPNFFGHYKITGYTQIGTSAFYELNLDFIGGNGTIGDKQYYDLVSFVLSTEAPPTEWGSITGDIEAQTDLINYISSQITIPTLQEVLDNNHDLVDGNNFQGTGAGIDNTGTEVNAFGISAAANNVGNFVNGLGNGAGMNNEGINVNALGTTAAFINAGNNVNALGDSAAFVNAGNNVNALGNNSGTGNAFNDVNLFGANANADEDGQTVLSKDGTIMARISTTDLTATQKYNLPDASGTIALTSDITIPTLQEVLDEGDSAVDSAIFLSNTANDFETSVNEFGDGGINLKSVVNDTLTSIGAGQVYLGTVDGSDNAIINKDGISVDSVNYAFPSGASSPLATLLDIPPSSVSPLTTKGDIYTYSTLDTRLPVGIDGQILTANSGVAEGLSWQDNYADWTSTVKHIVKNNGLSGTITKGTAVYVTSSDGTNMLVGRASNTSEATSSKTMGLMQSNITTTGGTQTGFVITEGLLAGLNTAGTTAGDPVWLGVNGALIYGLVNKPYAPNHLVFIGIVTKVSAGNGEIFVKVQNGFELKELHDVQAQNPSLNDILWYDNSVTPAQWKTASIATILGYTPQQQLNGTGFVKISGTTISYDNSSYYLSSNPSGFTSNLGTVTSVAALTLGTSGTDLSSTVANGTTTPVITLNVPTASATNRGVLSTTDWSAFNGKQNAITLTTTGSSGASTLIASTLNIPTYTLSGLGGVPVTRQITINGNTADLVFDRTFNVGTVTSVAALTLGTSGTDLSSSVATGTSTPVITLNIPTASATNRGVLSSADWSAFNNKQNTLGFVPFRFLQTSSTAHTGTVAETIIATATINGNTFSSNDIINTMFRVTKLNGSTAIMRVRINTTNTLVGATQIKLFNFTTTTNLYGHIIRTFNLQGGNLEGFSFTTSAIDDVLNVNNAPTSTPYNTANTLFIFFTLQLGATSHSATPTICNITN